MSSYKDEDIEIDIRELFYAIKRRLYLVIIFILTFVAKHQKNTR